MKKIIFALATTVLLLVAAACSGADAEWDGTFYNYLDDSHALVLTIEYDQAGQGFYGTATEIMTDNGITRIDVSLSAGLTKANVAEDGRGYRYTLNGDTLTVKYIDDDENIGTDFSGRYTRGVSIEEEFGLEAEDDDALYDDDFSSAPVAIVTSDYYYKNGTEGDISLYFYDDDKVDLTYPDAAIETYDYELDGRSVIFYYDGAEVLTLVIIDPYTLDFEAGGYQFIMP